MTREEAIKELSELEPREAEAWSAVSNAVFERDVELMKIEQQRQQFKRSQDEVVDALNSVHVTIYKRVQQLRMFLDMI